MTGEFYIQLAMERLRRGNTAASISTDLLFSTNLAESTVTAIVNSAQKRVARMDKDVVTIPNEARRTLDAYERFHSGVPCWDEESTDRYKFMSTTNLAPQKRDGLWHFSTRP